MLNKGIGWHIIQTDEKQWILRMFLSAQSFHSISFLFIFVELAEKILKERFFSLIGCSLWFQNNNLMYKITDDILLVDDYFDHSSIGINEVRFAQITHHSEIDEYLKRPSIICTNDERKSLSRCSHRSFIDLQNQVSVYFSTLVRRFSTPLWWS